MGAGVCDRWQTKNTCRPPEELYSKSSLCDNDLAQKGKGRKVSGRSRLRPSRAKAVSHKMSSVLTQRVNSNGQAGERTLTTKERLELSEDFFYFYTACLKETVPNKFSSKVHISIFTQLSRKEFNLTTGLILKKKMIGLR